MYISGPYIPLMKHHHVFLTTLDNAMCFCLCSHDTMFNFGASVCISPFHSDFTTYGPSKMKVKDLSSSSTVCSKGVIRWDVVKRMDAMLHLLSQDITFLVLRSVSLVPKSFFR